MKLKWKIDPAPTSLYGSFRRRAWPTACYAKSGRPAALIICEDSYSLETAKSGNHASLIILIADYSTLLASWKWVTLARKARTLDDAKAIALKAISLKPERWPEEERK